MPIKPLTRAEKALCKRIDGTNLVALEDFLDALDPASSMNFQLLRKLVRYYRVGELDALDKVQSTKNQVKFFDYRIWKELFGRDEQIQETPYKSVI